MKIRNCRHLRQKPLDENPKSATHGSHRCKPSTSSWKSKPNPYKNLTPEPKMNANLNFKSTLTRNLNSETKMNSNLNWWFNVEWHLNQKWMQILSLSQLQLNSIPRSYTPRSFDSKFRDHCTKKLDGALRKPTLYI